MKVWRGFGSEHSANLVMIGQFRTEADALAVEQIIEELAEQARSDEEAGELQLGQHEERFTEAMRSLLRERNLWNLAPNDVEMLVYDYSLERTGDRIRIWTDETDVAVFMKLMVERRAKVEVFSLHDHPEEEGTDRHARE